MTSSLRGRLRVLLIASTAVLLLVVALGLVFARQLTDASDDLVERTQPARIAAKELEVALLDQETGLRGYVISESTTFLGPYELGLSAQLAAEQEIETSLPDDDEVTSDVAPRGRSEQWRSEVVEPALEAIEAGDQEAALRILDELGKARFDSVRSTLDDLNETLLVRRTAAVDDLERSLRQLGTIGGAIVVLNLALIVVVSVALRRSVLDPLTQLGTDARIVADGDYDRHFEEIGPDEIRELAVSLESIRVRITDELAEVAAARRVLEEQADEIARSNRDLEQFAYVASHDLQEPLRKVAGFCQLLERRYADTLDDQAREYIAYAVDGAQRMQDLISDLLAFSRVGRTTERFEQVPLDEVVAAAWSGTHDHEGAQLTTDVLPVVAGDPTLLRTLFVNLLSNSVKFRGGTPATIQVEATTVGGMWEIAVQDDGIGIEPQFADRIFDIFQRLHTRDVYDGTGIGLALCKRIVEFHGGTLRLDPSPDGARFVVALPALSVDDSGEPVPGTSLQATSSSPIESAHT